MTLDVQTITTAILIGISLFLVKSFLKGYFETKIDVLQGSFVALKKELDDHIETCHKVPNDLLIERIENIGSKIDTNREYVKEMRDEFKEELELQRQRYHALNNHLIQIIGKLGGQLRDVREIRPE